MVLHGQSLKIYTMEYLGIADDLQSEKNLYQEYQDNIPMLVDGAQDEVQASPGYYDHFQNCIEVLKTVAKSKSLSLLIEGFYTDGGVFWNEEKFEVYHCFTPTTGKAFSSTLPCPIVVSGIHRPNFDLYTQKLVEERIKYFDKFLKCMKETNSHADEYTILFWFFEQIANDGEYMKSKLDQAIIKGYIDYPKYREVIKEKYPRIREAQIKNKVAEEIVSLYYAFLQAFQTKIQDSPRDRPIAGIDSVNIVEYNTKVRSSP